MTKILISDSLHANAENILRQNNLAVDVKINLEAIELQNIIINYDGLIVRSATKVNEEIIKKGKNLKIIGRAGSGLDNIDLEYAKKNNISVVNTPGANTNATAEHTFALLFSLYRNIVDANISTHKGLWEKKKFGGHELKNKILGIVGFGNVSSKLYHIAKGFDMKIITFSKSFNSRNDIHYDIKSVTFDELISKSDIISLNCNAPPDGKPIFTKNEFLRMKKNAIIINTARGNLINEKDLKEALDNSTISGAGIDVYSKEPAKENILFGTKNTILTPHIGASTSEAQINVAEQVALKFVDFFNNK